MLFDGSIPATEPVVMGHEGVGYVQDMGENVTGFKKGDRIGFLYIKGCCCKLCHQRNRCRLNRLIGVVECDGCLVHNLNCTRGSPKIQGFMSDGMFAEYAAIDRHNAIILPENLETESSAPYFCAGITGKATVELILPGHTLIWDSQPFTELILATSNLASGW